MLSDCVLAIEASMLPCAKCPSFCDHLPLSSSVPWFTQTEDYLKRKIRCRPERSELVRMHILEGELCDLYSKINRKNSKCYLR